MCQDWCCGGWNQCRVDVESFVAPTDQESLSTVSTSLIKNIIEVDCYQTADTLMQYS